MYSITSFAIYTTLWVHMHFQLLSYVFQWFIRFFNPRIDIINSFQLSRFVKLCLALSFLLFKFFFVLLKFRWHICPKSWSYVLGSVRLLNLTQFFTRFTCIPLMKYDSIKWTGWSRIIVLIVSGYQQYFNDHSSEVLAVRPILCVSV